MTDWHSTPPLVLGAFNFDRSPSPQNHYPSLIYTPMYTINDSCFHPLLFLSPYLPEILSVLE